MPWPSWISGLYSWSGGRDSEGHRIYKLRVQVTTASPLYGPATVLQTPGLPLPGAYWLIAADVDIYAWCQWDIDGPHALVDDEQNTKWHLTYTFSTRSPDPRRQRQPHSNASGGMNQPGQPDQGAQFPLMEPPKVSYSCVKFQEPGMYDKDGKRIESSSHEVLTGPKNEWDANRFQVTITQNVADLSWLNLSQLVDRLNQFTLWGQAPRCVKFSDFKAEKLYYQNALVYFQRTLIFDINADTFDRDIQDEGHKCLLGYWDNNVSSSTYGLYLVNLDPDTSLPLEPTNPANFGRFRDRKNQYAKCYLDGNGAPYNVDEPQSAAGVIHVKKYKEADLSLIPQLPAAL